MTNATAICQIDPQTQQMGMGECIMSDWGKVVYNKARGHWAVKGTWQGKRCYFSQYQSQIGPITCETEAMANRLREAIRTDIDQGHFNPARYNKTRPLHLEKYAGKWLKEVKPDISSGTWHGYECALRLYIGPTIGDRFLPDIGHPDLKLIMKAMDHLSVKRKKNVMGCLHKLMMDAHRDGHITQMPPWIEFRGKNKVVRPPVKYLSVKDQLKILDHIPLRHRHIFMFMMSCGCRPSEARALRKKDVHDDHILFMVAFGYKGELKDLKNHRARSFPIHEELKMVLDMTPKAVSNWYFVNPDTNKHYSKDVNRIWNAACKDAKVGYFKLYNAMRHSYGSQLLNAGVAKETIARLLGHTDLRQVDTYATYETASLEHDAGKVKRFSDIKKDEAENG